MKKERCIEVVAFVIVTLVSLLMLGGYKEAIFLGATALAGTASGLKKGGKIIPAVYILFLLLMIFVIGKENEYIGMLLALDIFVAIACLLVGKAIANIN